MPRQGTARPGSPSARRGENVVRDVSAHRFSRGGGPNALRAGRALPVPPTARSAHGRSGVERADLQPHARGAATTRATPGVCTRSHAPAQARQRAPHDAQALAANGRCSCATCTEATSRGRTSRRNQRHLYGITGGLAAPRATTPPREGPALLQGLVLCGVCGKRMGVRLLPE